MDKPSTPKVKDAAITVGAVLASIWTLLQIIGWIAQRTKDPTSKESFVTACLAIAAIGLPLAGVFTYAVFKSPKIGVALLFLAALVVSYQYLRHSAPAERFETFMVVIAWSGFTFISLSILIERIIGVLERVANPTSKL